MTKKEFNEAKKSMKERGYSELTVIDKSINSQIVMILPLRMANYNGEGVDLSAQTKLLLSALDYCIRDCNFVISHNKNAIYSKKVELETVMNYVKSII